VSRDYRKDYGERLLSSLVERPEAPGAYVSPYPNAAESQRSVVSVGLPCTLGMPLRVTHIEACHTGLFAKFASTSQSDSPERSRPARAETLLIPREPAQPRISTNRGLRSPSSGAVVKRQL